MYSSPHHPHTNKASKLGILDLKRGLPCEDTLPVMAMWSMAVKIRTEAGRMLPVAFTIPDNSGSISRRDFGCAWNKTTTLKHVLVYSYLVGVFFPPVWKICSSNWIISPARGEKKIYIWNHHLVMVYSWSYFWIILVYSWAMLGPTRLLNCWWALPCLITIGIHYSL